MRFGMEETYPYLSHVVEMNMSVVRTNSMRPLVYEGYGSGKCLYEQRWSKKLYKDKFMVYQFTM